MMLYPDFLENPVSYDTIQVMWKEFFDELAKKNGFSHTPYINMCLSNGEKDRDGNPIFSALAVNLNRGVRIIQDNQVEDAEQFISGWLDRIEDCDGLPDFDELVIPLMLSEATKAIAEAWIHAWLVEQVDKETMKQLLEEKAILVAE